MLPGSSYCATWGTGTAEGKGGGGRNGRPTALELHYLSELRNFIEEKGDCHAASCLLQRPAAPVTSALGRCHEWRPSKASGLKLAKIE